MSALPGPLPSGLTVVELGGSVAAPYAAQILGDLGARVVKVEKASGDDARKWGPPFWEDAGAMFQALNRNKVSVVADLSDARDRARVVAFIVEQADVVIQNMRPGQTTRLGLDAAPLLAAKPSLVYCNMGAFGRTGPLADRPGYDPLMQAFGGVMSVTGREGDDPVRVGPSIIDMGTGMWAVIGILAALHRRERSNGQGGVVDVSLFETAAALVSLQAAQYLASGATPRKHGSGIAGIVPYKAFRASDGDLIIAAGNDDLFGKLATVLARPDLASDARFRSNPLRVENSAALYAEIEAIVRTRAVAHWLDALERAGVPAAPVQDIPAMLAHRQTQAMELVQPLPDSSMQAVGLPISFDGARPQPRMRPPRLGEHSDLVTQTRAVALTPAGQA